MMQMVRRHRRSLLLTLMLTVFVSVFSQSDDSARFSKYPYIFILDENQEPSITDEQFYKAQAMGLSDARLYKMAGNSVTVPVISAIGEKIRAVNEKYQIVRCEP